ncbi:DgyrCDS14232 [Dimorphilus gyrociliatus]|uniref:DgyrCDS14232 n=1 Tax=Dimorphilus gyrociliatus TaxID=2664684 RepID=A0A7I8WD22_9ANNE|nr:DgyrCDS14232 [Dimorphilus gyrociliatus]
MPGVMNNPDYPQDPDPYFAYHDDYKSSRDRRFDRDQEDHYYNERPRRNNDYSEQSRENSGRRRNDRRTYDNDYQSMHDEREDLYSKVRRPHRDRDGQNIGAHNVVESYNNSERGQRRRNDNMNREEGQIIDLDHLVTMSMDRVRDIKEGIEYLRGIRQWLNKLHCSIEVARGKLFCYEAGTKKELEVYPLDSISHVTPVESIDNIYNNVILFVINGEVTRELAAFQCVDRSAHEVADMIERAKMIKRDRPISPQPSERYTDEDKKIVMNRVKMIEQAQTSLQEAGPYVAGQTKEKFRKSMRRSNERHDSNASLLDEKTERDSQMLNRCFDDIERFIYKLQQAAEYHRRLKAAGRRNRRDDGILTERSRPPPSKEFIEVFQKFKLSFILLAKLRDDIFRPTAPELIAHLFTPLNIIVSASRDPETNQPEIASKVVSPLLTRQAKELLEESLTERERFLWESLGPSWTQTREEWTGYVPPYYPNFEGLSSRQDVTSEAEFDHPRQPRGRRHEDSSRYERERPRQESNGQKRVPDTWNSEGLGYGDDEPVQPEVVRREQARHSAEKPKDYDSNPRNSRETNKSSNKAQKAVTEKLPSNPEERNLEFYRRLLNENADIAKATASREGSNNKELDVYSGEYLKVLDHSRNWWKLMNADGNKGFAPFNILSPINGDLQPPAPTSHRRSVSSESSVSNIPKAPPPPPESWKYERPNGSRSSIPENDSNEVQQQKKKTSNYERDVKYSKQASQQDTLNLELKNRLTMGKTERDQFRSKQRVSVTIISDKSSADEVREWLRNKRFDNEVIEALQGRSGRELFDLSKRQIEQICGYDEADRLETQLNVQKGKCGYKSKESAELQRILRSRKSILEDN